MASRKLFTSTTSNIRFVCALGATLHRIFKKLKKQQTNMSGKIVKCEEEFEWTDELVVEFTTWSLNNSPAMQGRYADIEQFKASKQRKCLFITEDGKEVFEDGADLICVEKDFSTRKAYISHFSSPINGNKYFYTEAAAKEYVRLNKPMYSLNDIHNAWRKCDGGYLDLINTLEKIKQ